MKQRLFIALGAAVLAVFNVFAAQCVGLTKDGLRCKRDAAEGSKYCLGHADQAKNGAPGLKDDGTCWAVTKNGLRCKHKKDGASDYCKQHAADKKPAKPVDQCRALTTAGSRCTRKPTADCYYCEQHAKLGKAAPADKAKKPAEPTKK